MGTSPKSENNDGFDFDPLGIETISQIDEMNHEFAGKQPLEINGTTPTTIVAHQPVDGGLQFSVQFSSGKVETFNYCNMQMDYPALTAQYILENNVTRRATGKRDTVQAWARKTLCDLERTVCCLRRVYDFGIRNDNTIFRIRRTTQMGTLPAKKKRHYDNSLKIKYGVKVPRSVREALAFDAENGDTFWQDAICAEIGTLIEMECFKFHKKDFKHDPAFQLC